MAGNIDRRTSIVAAAALTLMGVISGAIVTRSAPRRLAMI